VEPLYGLAKVLFRRPLHHGFKWRVEGVDRIPGRGPAILASNHISYLDPLCLAYVADLAGRRVRFLAKAELFDRRWLAWILRSMGQIPVYRGTADASGALVAAAAALQAGECVVVFPEGTISRDFEPMAGRTGTARLARAVGAPVVPVGVWGTHRTITAGRRPKLRPGVAVSVVVGEALAIGPEDHPRETTDRIMTAICAQVARAREIYPQRPRSERSDWWVRRPETARLRSCRGRVTQDIIDAASSETGEG
jgi:1-acyl-sn-glycerol-3-phosphate acyltransferase